MLRRWFSLRLGVFAFVLSMGAGAPLVQATDYVRMYYRLDFASCTGTSTPLGEVDNYIAGDALLSTADSTTTGCSANAVSVELIWNNDFPALSDSIRLGFNALRAYINTRQWPTILYHDYEFYYGDEAGEDE